jgi:hypothetical protein
MDHRPPKRRENFARDGSSQQASRFKLWKTRRVKNQRFESSGQLWKTEPESASFLRCLFSSLRAAGEAIQRCDPELDCFACGSQ